jgi:hemolysin III
MRNLAMNTLTGSFRLADLSGASHVGQNTRRRRATSVAAVESISRLCHSTASLESAPSLPGYETAARLAQALTRPAVPGRTAAENVHEEHVNAITHGLGLMISLLGCAYLLGTATTVGWKEVLGCGIYGGSLVAMYLASTSLHVAESLQVRGRFQMADHVAIYLLIAGTYTPFLLAIEGHCGLVLLGCVWALAAIGISIKVKYADRLEETSPLPYVGLGWLALGTLKPLMAILPTNSLALLVIGGVAYTLGVPFYCRDDKRYFHAVWHLFVMAGTGCHFAAVLLHVV